MLTSTYVLREHVRLCVSTILYCYIIMLVIRQCAACASTLITQSIPVVFCLSTVDHLMQVLDWMRPPAPGRRSHSAFPPALSKVANHKLCAGLVPPVNDLGVQAQEYGSINCAKFESMDWIAILL